MSNSSISRRYTLPNFKKESEITTEDAEKLGRELSQKIVEKLGLE